MYTLVFSMCQGRRTRASCRQLLDDHAALDPLKELLAQLPVVGVSGVCEALLGQGEYAVSYFALREYLDQQPVYFQLAEAWRYRRLRRCDWLPVGSHLFSVAD